MFISSSLNQNEKKKKTQKQIVFKAVLHPVQLNNNIWLHILVY